MYKFVNKDIIGCNMKLSLSKELESGTVLEE